MESDQGALLRGRKLLQHHCSGSDTLMGSANVGASIFILLLLGFVAGFGTSWLVSWRRQRRRLNIELEYRSRHPAQLRVPEVAAAEVESILKAAKTPTIRGDGGGPDPLPALSRLPRSAAALASGPLALGFASFKGGGAGGELLSASKAGSAFTPGRSSSGNPFADAGLSSSFNVIHNPAAAHSLNASLEMGQPAAAVQRSGSSAGRIAAYQPAAATAAPEAAPAVAASLAASVAASGAWGGMSVEALPTAQQPAAQHARSGTVVEAPGGGAPSATTAAGQSADYAAALGGPAAAAGGGAAALSAKDARNQERLSAVASEQYDLSELDPEWVALLEDLDRRLVAGGRPALGARERAVAIRSLIVATASASADAALDRAAADVEAHRQREAARGGQQ